MKQPKKPSSRWYHAADIEPGDTWKTVAGDSVTIDGIQYPISSELERALTAAADDAGMDYFAFVREATAYARRDKIEQALEKACEAQLPAGYALIVEEHADVYLPTHASVRHT
jgi:hypothetical protein